MSQLQPDGATLLPTTAEITRICPRFRLLVVGNTGVGKSTLIEKVFGVDGVDISNKSRGQANINREFEAKDNGLFVLHDSCGLEPGGTENLETIKHFVDERRKMKELKDQLHAVWICLGIPYAKGRLLETGMEDFLKARKQIFGDIPIVVVLTKLDLLDSMLLSQLYRSGAARSLAGARAILGSHKTAFLEKHCVEPLRKAKANDIPRVSVSAKKGFGLESTISDLVKTTIAEIERYVAGHPSPYTETSERSSLERNAPVYIAGMAQRASIEENVELTIALGKRRYWRNLTASLRFSEKKIKDYILVIHKEIVEAWNFNDPEMALRGDDFKVALLDAPNLGTDEIKSITAALGSLTSAVTPLAPLITTMPHAIVIALPVVGVTALASLCMEIYKSTKTIVKRFMAYIADLVYVMKILFILAPSGFITSRDVALAVDVYMKSPYRNGVHALICEFDVGFVVLPGKRDAVMEKTEEVVRRFNITDKAVAELRCQIARDATTAKAPAA